MFPIRLRVARYVAKMSQEDVSDRLGIHLDVYQDYESGKREPYLSTGYRLEKLLKEDIHNFNKPIRKESFAMYEGVFNEKLERGIPRPKGKIVLSSKHKSIIQKMKNEENKKVVKKKSRAEIKKIEDIQKKLISMGPEYSKISLNDAEIIMGLKELKDNDYDSYEIVRDLISLALANQDIQKSRNKK